MAHVFISYLHDDSPVVDRLVAEVRALGVNVWLDRDDIEPGEHWRAAIKRAISSGALFVACFSRDYGRRADSYMEQEVAWAVSELTRRGTRRRWFIPVQLDETEVPGLSIGGGQTLRDLQWLNTKNSPAKVAREIASTAIRNVLELEGSWPDASQQKEAANELPRLEQLAQILRRQRLNPYPEVRHYVYDALQAVVDRQLEPAMVSTIEVVTSAIELAQERITLHDVDYYWDEVAALMYKLIQCSYVLHGVRSQYPILDQPQRLSLTQGWRSRLDSEFIVTLVRTNARLQMNEFAVLAQLLKPGGVADEEAISAMVYDVVRAGALQIVDDRFIEDGDDAG